MLHLQLLVHVRDAIIAGSTGRMAMLLLIYGGPLIGLPRIDVVSALGSLAAPNKQDAVTLGGAIHFTMGILFAIIYASLWSLGIGSPTWWWGLIFGLVHGMLVIVSLYVVLHRYPQLSEILNGLPVGLVVAIVYST